MSLNLNATLDLAWVDRLQERPEGWNGYDAAAPDPCAIEHARAWIVRWCGRTGPDDWVMPHVTSSAEGEVVFEWFHREKKLTIYVSAEEQDYVRSWGPDIATEMEDGGITDERMPGFWQWLWSD